ncbi:MAG: Flp pilus assembly protein CpaB [Dehalococcoidia bacterium]|nr:Flp pilus assembly protein CpaB [Dehalococcoidia bacterium]
MARTLSRTPERTNRLILYGAIALAALAAVLIFVALSRSSGAGSTSKAAAGDMTVVTAAVDIKAGTKITDDLLTTTTVASSNAIAGVLTDRKTTIGLTTVYPIAKGEQLSSAKLVGGADAKTSPSYIIPAGKRAFAVAISSTTSANQLLVAGDRVDVIAVGKQSLPQTTTSGTQEKDFPASITLLQNIEVLAVENVTLKPTARLDANGKPITSATSDGSLSTNPNPQDTQTDAKVAVLSVDPQQAQQLAVAADGYKIYLSLRAPGDTATPLDPKNIVTLPANIQ